MALQLPWGAALTYDDLQNIPEDGHRYELLDGTLLVTPSPNHAHQRCLLNLAVLLRNAAPPDQEVIVAPFDWLIGPQTSFEPDVLVARRADVVFFGWRTACTSTRRRCRGRNRSPVPRPSRSPWCLPGCSTEGAL